MGGEAKGLSVLCAWLVPGLGGVQIEFLGHSGAQQGAAELEWHPVPAEVGRRPCSRKTGESPLIA